MCQLMNMYQLMNMQKLMNMYQLCINWFKINYIGT